MSNARLDSHLKRDTSTGEQPGTVISMSFLKDCSSIQRTVTTEQAKSLRQSAHIHLNRHYASSLAETATAKRDRTIHQLTAQKLPSLEDKDSCLSWFRTPTPTMSLEKLLKLSRLKRCIDDISLKDLGYVIRCCDYDGWFPLTERRKLAKLAIKILSYIAQNHRQLPQKAIEALVAELSKKDRRTFANATLALGYAINNGQHLPNQKAEKLFEGAVRSFYSGSFHLNFPIIAVGLSALAKQGKYLQQQDLDKLKRILVYVGNKFLSPYPPTSAVRGFARSDRRKWYRSLSAELRNLKDIASNKMLLAESELEYVGCRWDSGGLKENTKIVKILKLSIENGQRNLPVMENVLRILEEGVSHEEREVKINAMAALGFLITSKDNAKNKYSEHLSLLNDALNDYRKYAISALNNHVHRCNQELANINEWQEILQQLQYDRMLEISNTARFILFYLNNDQASLEELLLGKTSCVETTIIFLNVAKEKMPLSEKTLINLGKILHGNYPIEAKYNAIEAICLAAENQQTLPRSTLQILLNECLIAKDVIICNKTFNVLGIYAAKDVRALLSRQVLDNLTAALSCSGKNQNASFALQKIFEHLNELNQQYPFDRIISTVGNLLMKEVGQPELGKNLALIILHAAKKHFVFSPLLLSQIADSIYHADNKIVKAILLSALGYFVSSAKSILFAPNIIAILVACLDDSDEKIQQMAAEILCDYSAKTKQEIPTHLLEKISKHITDPKMSLLVTQFLRNCADKKWNLPAGIIDLLANAINDEEEVQLNVAYIFCKVAGRYKINVQSMIFFQAALKSKDSEVIEYIVRGLKKVLVRDPEQKYKVSSETCLALAQVTSDYSCRAKLRVNAASTLYLLSRTGRRLTNHVIHALILSCHSSNQKLSKLVLNTLQHQVRFIVSELVSDTDYAGFFEGLEKRLNNINDDLLESVLLILREATEYNYCLSKKSLMMLAEIMQWHDKESTRNLAYEILRKTRLPKELQDIASVLQAEEDGRTLGNSGSIGKKYQDAAKRLHVFAKGKKKLPRNVFSSIEKQLTGTEKNSLYPSLAAICYYSIKNGQQLPASLLVELSRLASLHQLQGKRYDALTIALAAKQGEYLTPAAFALFEYLLVEKKEINLEYLCAIQVSVERNMPLQHATLERLIELLDDKNKDVSILCAKIICALSQKKTCPRSSIEAIMRCLPRAKEKGTIKHLSLALKCLIAKTSFQWDQELINLISVMLITVNDAESQQNILEILECLKKHQSLPMETQQLIAFKEQEKIFLDERMNLSLRIHALQVLKYCPHYFNQAIFDKFEVILADEPSELKNGVLSALAAQGHCCFPGSILLSLVNLLNEQEYALIAFNILLRAAELHINFPAESIKSLVHLMINSPDLGKSELAFLILDKIKGYQSQGLEDNDRELIRIEGAGYQLRAGQGTRALILRNMVESIINANLLISINNFYVLCEFLGDKDSDLRKLAAQALSHSIFQFDLTLLNKLAAYLLEVFPYSKTSELKHMLEFVVSSGHLSPDNKENFYKLLLNKIRANKFDIDTLHLLASLVQRNHLPISDDLIKLLIDKILRASSQDLRNQLVYTLLIITKHTSVINEEILNYYGKLFVDKKNNSLQSASARFNLDYLFSPLAGLSHLNDMMCHSVIKLTSLAPLSGAVNTSSSSAETKSTVYQKELLQLMLCLYRRHPQFSTIVTPPLEGLYSYLEETNKIKERHINKLKELSFIEQATILLTIATRNNNTIKRLDDCPYGISSRELLCRELISNVTSKNSADEDLTMEIQRFYLVLEDFEKTKNYELFSLERDNILDLLIEKQLAENLSLSELIDILVILKQMPQKSDCLLSLGYSQLRVKWLQVLTDRLFSQAPLNHGQLVQLNNLIEKLGWNADLVGEFFNNLPKASFQEINRFLSFLAEYDIEVDLFIRVFSNNLLSDTWDISTLRLDLSRKVIKNKLQYLQYHYPFGSVAISRGAHLEYRLSKLMERGWSLERISSLIDKLSTTMQGEDVNYYENFCLAIDIAYCYDVPEDRFYQQDIFSSELVSRLHQVAISLHFENGTDEKDLSTLLNELNNLNEKNPSVKKLLETHRLESLLRIPTTSHSMPQKPINLWSISDIQSWAAFVKKNHCTLPEMLAVIKRACFLHFKYEPRTVQLMAVVAMLHGKTDLGRFAEVATGEGKSAIIAMLAVIKALQGKKVDIITSSPLLAKRDAEEYEEFYKIFGINVASNGDSRYSHGLKKCYGSDITVVYGDASNFQFDLLRDYSGLGTRGKRDFETVIVDEVDNLLIDEGARIAMLATAMPGMDQLELLLLAIWRRLSLIHQDILRAKELSDNQDPQEISQLNNTELTKLLAKRLRDYAFEITDKGHDPHLDIPVQLQDFVKHQIPKWVESAIIARFDYQKGHHYSIEPDKHGSPAIVPIDFANTGVLQNDTNWGDGLQQFLQIKHNLKICSESLITNFISNMSYIRRYGSNIYGLTGTLGSEESCKLLAEIYPIDFISIPTYKTKQFHELPSFIVGSEVEWLEEITVNAIREASQGRVVLVMCETMNKAKKIQERLFKNYKDGHIKSYIHSDNEQNHLNGVIEEGTIIVATNLAGRGTDIRLSSKAIKKGGLHVCCTFLPLNERVEDQAFGRTSRKGEPGTAQLILQEDEIKEKLKNHLPLGLSELAIADVRKARNEAEKAHLIHVRNHELLVTENKDFLYTEFLKLLKELQEIDVRENAFVSGLFDVNEDLGRALAQTLNDSKAQYKKAAVEERWGLWLKELDINASKKEVDRKFLEFKKLILEEYKNDSVIKNPAYYIRQGNDLLIRANKLKTKALRLGFCDSLYRDAIAAYDKAIALDPIYAYMAHYNKACALVKIHEGDYKDVAKGELRKAQDIISTCILPQLQAVLQLIEQSHQIADSSGSHEFEQQIYNKIEILQQLLGSVNSALTAIERSQKLIDVKQVSTNSTLSVFGLNKSQALNAVQACTGHSITLSFHDLKAHKDIWTSYQSTSTIAQAKHLSDKVEVNIIFESKNLSSAEGEAGAGSKDTLKSLLPINRHRASEQKKQSLAEEKTSRFVQKNVGVADYVAGAGRKVAEATSTLSGAAKGAYSAVSDTIKNGYNAVDDLMWGYKDAEKIPVMASLPGLDFAKTLAVLAKTEKYKNVNLKIRNVPQKVLADILRNCSLARKAKLSQSEVKTHDRLGLPSCMESAVAHRNDPPDEGDIEFKDLSGKEAKQLAEELCQLSKKYIFSAEIELMFSAVSQQRAEELIDLSEGQVNLSFCSLKMQDANKILYLTALHNGDAIVQFTNLSRREATYLINHAKRKEENFSVTLQPIQEVFQKISNSKQELLECSNNGFVYLFNLQELNPRPWKSIVLVTALAALQIAGGVALVAATHGFTANLGLSLIGEGLGDLVRAISIYYSREFSLNSYMLQKSFSLAISLATAGISAYQLSQQAATLGSEVAGLVDDAALAGRSIAGMIGNASKQVLTKSAELGATELTNYGIERLGKATFKQISPMVDKSVQDTLHVQFQNGYWRKILDKICAVDKYLGTPIYQDRLLMEADRIINGMELGLIGVGPINLEAINFDAFANFEREFSAVIREMDKEIMAFDLLLYKHCRPKLSKEAAREICLFLREQNILTADGAINLTFLFKKNVSVDKGGYSNIFAYHTCLDIDDIDASKLRLGEYEKYKTLVIQACMEYVIAREDDYFYLQNALCHKIGNIFSSQINSRIHSVLQVAQEGTKFLAGMGISAISGLAQDALEPSEINPQSFNSTDQGEDIISKVRERSSPWKEWRNVPDSDPLNPLSPEKAGRLMPNTNSPARDGSRLRGGRSRGARGVSDVRSQPRPNKSTPNSPSPRTRGREFNTSEKLSPLSPRRIEQRPPNMMSRRIHSEELINREGARMIPGTRPLPSPHSPSPRTRWREFDTSERLSPLSPRRVVEQRPSTPNSPSPRTRGRKFDTPEKLSPFNPRKVEHRPSTPNSPSPRTRWRKFDTSEQLSPLSPKRVRPRVPRSAEDHNSFTKRYTKFRKLNKKNISALERTYSKKYFPATVKLPLSSGSPKVERLAYKIVFGCSLITAREIFLDEYQRSLMRHYHRTKHLLQVTFIRCKEHQISLYEDLLEESKKGIKLLVTLIVLEQKILERKLNDENQINYVYTEEVSNAIELIFNQILTNPSQGNHIIDKYIAEEHYAHLKELMAMFSRSLGEFNKILKEIKMLTKTADKFLSDVNFGNVAGQIIQGIKDQRLSESALLLKEGKLGESGYVAGKVFDTLATCYMQSQAMSARIQMACIESLNAAMENEQKFQGTVVEMTRERARLMDEMDKRMGQELNNAVEIFKEAMKTGDKDIISAAKEALQIVKEAQANRKELAISIAGIDAGTIEKFIAASQAIVQGLIKTLDNMQEKDMRKYEIAFATAERLASTFFKKNPPQQPNSLPSSQQAPALPSTSTPLSPGLSPSAQYLAEGDKNYATGRLEFRKGNKNAAYGFFSVAKNWYKKANKVSNLDADEQKKIKKKLGHLDDNTGKYGMTKLSN